MLRNENEVTLPYAPSLENLELVMLFRVHQKYTTHLVSQTQTRMVAGNMQSTKISRRQKAF